MSKAALLELPISRTSEEEEVATAYKELSRSSYRAMHNIVCELVDGRLVLHGTVPTFYLKQLAQEIVLRAVGSYPLSNEIDVAH